MWGEEAWGGGVGRGGGGVGGGGVWAVGRKERAEVTTSSNQDIKQYK